jgi:hypothetical protein
MKTGTKRIILFLWLLVAGLQLLFSASVAPAKPLPCLENRVWEIFSLAAQTHQVSQLQVAGPQRERAPPATKIALGVLLDPETNAILNVQGSNGLTVGDFMAQARTRLAAVNDEFGGVEAYNMANSSAQSPQSGLIGVTSGESSALARQTHGIEVDGQPAVSSIAAFGSRAGSTFRGRGPQPTSD